jgi:MFS transporter, CP family, cyanate transporter
LALSFIVLRSSNPVAASQLSGFVQSIGYVVGGLLGPLMVGFIHSWSNSWAPVAFFYSVICGSTLILGLGAGKDRVI